MLYFISGCVGYLLFYFSLIIFIPKLYVYAELTGLIYDLVLPTLVFRFCCTCKSIWCFFVHQNRFSHVIVHLLANARHFIKQVEIHFWNQLYLSIFLYKIK